MKRLSVLAALGLLLAVSLWATAAPALADDYYDGNPPGSQWGGHDINAKMNVVGMDRCITFLIVADDPRVCGLMEVTIKDAWDDEDGLAHTSGTYDLYNDDGSWHCAYWECIYSRSLAYEGGWQGLVLSCTAKGSGDYRNLVFVMSHHQAVNSSWIVKGWILPAR